MLGLAPDGLLARAAERLATPQQWQAPGSAPGLVWAEFLNTASPPNHVSLTLPDLALACDCASHKWPCRHAVGLALLYAQEPALFPPAEPPTWLHTQPLGELPSGSSTLAAQRRAYRKQLAAVQRGMAQMEIWLRDLVHGGLADLAGGPVVQWRDMAVRLSDAGALRTAATVRELATLPGSRPDWPEELLRRLGRLYLLSQGFARYAELAPEAQADLRGAAGWFSDPDRPGTDEVHDCWLVLGTKPDYDGRAHVRRTWLWGAEARRFAFLEYESQRNEPQASTLGGALLNARLRFAPGGWPARAEIVNLEGPGSAAGSAAAQPSIAAGRASYGRALSLNPWLRAYPLLLRGVSAALDDERWELLDEEGHRLPLPKPFLHGWHLQALAGDTPGLLFGEWDGRVFTPLALQRGDAWLPLHVLRGQA